MEKQNSILIITALLPNLNATAAKKPFDLLEQRCSICAGTVVPKKHPDIIVPQSSLAATNLFAVVFAS